MSLNKDSWRAKVRKPVEVQIASLGDSVLIRPMSAGRQSAINERFPSGEDGMIKDPVGFTAAIIADSVVSDLGEAVWSTDEVKELEPAVFVDLRAAVEAVILPAQPKN